MKGFRYYIEIIFSCYEHREILFYITFLLAPILLFNEYLMIGVDDGVWRQTVEYWRQI